MSVLAEKAKEGSTYIVTITFTDEAGVTFTPVSASWSLRDANNNIVNSRNNVSMTPATSVSVILSGADLSYLPITKQSRTFTVTGVYNSSTYGNGLPFADECTFDIDSLIGVADA